MKRLNPFRTPAPRPASPKPPRKPLVDWDDLFLRAVFGFLTVCFLVGVFVVVGGTAAGLLYVVRAALEWVTR